MPRRHLPVNQLASGRWQARWRDDAGRQRAKTFRTAAEARDYLTKTKADLARGVYLDPDDGAVTFGEYAKEWAAAQPWAPGTRAAVRASLNRLEELSGVPLARLRRSQVQAVITGLSPELAPGTVGLVAQHLRQVLNGAVADRMIAANPAAGLRLPRAGGGELVIPTVEEVHAIADAIDGRSRALVVVGAGLGLRQGEAFGLSRDRIDFMRRRVTIDRQLVRLDRGSMLAPPKTARSVRTIPLPTFVAEELARHLEQWPSDDPDGLIFTAAWGGRLRRDGWNRRAWKPAAEAAKRPELTFHALRHFYASALIRRDHSAVVIARRLGNSPAMVQSTYAHLWRDDDDRTRDAIDDVLAPSSEGERRQA